MFDRGDGEFRAGLDVDPAIVHRVEGNAWGNADAEAGDVLLRVVAQVMQMLKSYVQIESPDQAPDVQFRREAAAAQTAIRDLIAAARATPGGARKARVIRFLADADFNQKIVVGLRRREPSVDILDAHHGGVVGLRDPEVLRVAAESGGF